MFQTFMTRDIEKKETGTGLNVNYFLNCDDKIKTPSLNAEKANTDDLSPEKKRRGRPKKEDGVAYVAVDDENKDLPLYQSNQPYINSYKETNDMLKQSIGEIDMLNSQITADVIQIRANKNLRNKYHLISNLTSASASMLSAKLGAIREINSSITNGHNLDMKRIKEFNNSVSEQDDDKRIQDLYSAYMNMPIGQAQMSIPNSQEISMFDMSQGYFTQQPQNQQFQMTPELNAIINESNPYVEEVVIQNDSLPAGMNLRYEYIDNRTGEPVPGMKPTDAIFLANLSFDRSLGIARDTNLNKTYRLVVESGMPNMY